MNASLPRHLVHPFVVLAVLFVALLLGGCTTTEYQVRVASVVAQKNSPNTSYRIVDRPMPAEGKALYVETGRLLRVALATRGLTEAPPTTEPDLLISFASGIGATLTRNSIQSEPIYMMVPGAIRYETTQVGTTATGAPIMGTVARQDPPSQQLMGYQNRDVQIKLYRKHLQVRAFRHTPGADSATPQGAWAFDVIQESEDQNVAASLPILAAAGMIYAGKETTDLVTVHLKDSDADVRAIKRGK